MRLPRRRLVFHPYGGQSLPDVLGVLSLVHTSADTAIDMNSEHSPLSSFNCAVTVEIR